MTRQHVFILAIAALCSSTAQAVIPKSGTFDIDNSSELTFTPIPCVSPPGVDLWPFASSDKYSTGPYSKYNLAEVRFSAGSFIVIHSNEKSGDLGIRVGNYTGSTQIFEACIFTMDFVGSGSFNVYLPEFTFGKSKEIFFWIAESGATYYANSSKGVGLPDMYAAYAMSAGDEYLAGVPEPATILLLGLGGLALRKFNRGVHRARGDF